MGDEYTAEEDLQTAEDMGMLEEEFDELESYLDGINQLRMNEEE